MLIADLEEKLQDILTTATVESENKGLQLNATKTECMVISKQSDIPVCKILSKGERIKQIVPLLGLRKNSRCQVRHRNKEKNSFVSRQIHQDEVLLHQQKYQNLHQNQHSESLRPILLHGHECWTLTKDVERRLEAAEMRHIRKIISIPRSEITKGPYSK